MSIKESETKLSYYNKCAPIKVTFIIWGKVNVPEQLDTCVSNTIKWE